VGYNLAGKKRGGRMTARLKRLLKRQSELNIQEVEAEKTVERIRLKQHRLMVVIAKEKHKII